MRSILIPAAILALSSCGFLRPRPDLTRWFVLATIEEIHGAIPDCAPGAIPPFGSLWGLRTFVDRTLLNVRDITMPAGDVATAIRMEASEFQRLVGARIGDFAVPETLMPTHATGG